jgi:hypothetical protein
MSFRGVFVDVVIAAALVVAAFLVNSRRPLVEVIQPTAALARAVGKCAECHRQETSAVVHEFEMSAHARKGVTCLGYPLSRARSLSARLSWRPSSIAIVLFCAWQWL